MYGKISLIIGLQVVTHSGSHLEKNNCCINRIKDETKESVYYLGNQETQSLALFQLRNLSYSPVQQVLSNFKSVLLFFAVWGGRGKAGYGRLG